MMIMSSKKQITNRLVSVFMALMIIATMVPVSALTVLAEETAIYKIVVTDGTSAIEDADVTINAEGKEIEKKKTNEKGEVEFSLQENIDYKYSVEKIGYDTVKEVLDINVEKKEVVLKAKKVLTVTGTVSDESNKPLKNVSIKVDGYKDYTTKTGANGEFSLEGIYDGENYTVTAELTKYKTTSMKLKLDSDNKITLTALKEDNLKFEKSSLTIKYGETGINVAKGTKAFADSYSSSNTGVATVDNNGKVTAVGIGTAQITATLKETEDYLLTTAKYTVTVVKGVQNDVKWTQTIPDNLTWKDTFSNTLEGGNGGKVNYTVDKNNIAEVDENGNLTFKKPGTVKITGVMTGGDLYEDISDSYTITVTKAEQDDLVFDDAHPNAIYYGESITNTAIGGSVDGKPIYNSSNENVVTVDKDGKLTTIKNGVATITAILAGNELYGDVTAEYEITVYRADQKNAFIFEKGNTDQTIKYGEEFVNAANGGENNPISYKSSDEAVATVDENGKITTFKAGETTITAINPEDDRYKSKEISYKLVVERADQTVDFVNGNVNIPAITYGDNYQNKALAKTDITYTSSDESVAEVDKNGKLTVNRHGDVTITATAKATEQYNEASSSYTIHINKAEQVITFGMGEKPNVTFNDNENIFINKATTNAINNGEKDITAQYLIVSGADLVDDFDNNTGSFKIKGAGTVDVTVSFDSNDRYNQAIGKYRLTVSRSKQTIKFDKSEYSVKTGENFTAPKAVESSDNFGSGVITYAVVEDPDGVVKLLDENTGEIELTYKPGSVKIKATKAADIDYEAADSEYLLKVEQWVSDDKHYSLKGDYINDSGWFVGNVSVVADEGYQVSYNQLNGEASWEDKLTDAITTDGENNSVSFYVKDIKTGYISEQYTEVIKKDTVLPTLSINAKGMNDWEKFLSIVTFGLWEKDKDIFTIECDDKTSGVASVEYYIDEGSDVVKSKEELDSVTAWTEYKDEAFSIEKNSVCVVYAKVTDIAGNYNYASTNGIVFDETDPTAEISIVTKPTEYGFYNDDVSFNVSVSDAKPYSGIAKVQYWVECDGKITTISDDYPDGIVDLYSFNNDNPKYSDLIQTWQSENIIIDALDNNSDNVTVWVRVFDNAGNEYTTSKDLRISAKDPTIDVSFYNDPEIKGTDNNGVVYYDNSRTATVVVTGRTSVFDKDNDLGLVGINIAESRGDTEKDKTYEISDWVTIEPTAEEIAKGLKTTDDATHTATITFYGSACYSDFAINYTDKAQHSAKPYIYEGTFSVDKDDPTGTITVADSTWNKLIESLTFGLWENESVEISATSQDATGEIKSIEYYKSNDDEIVTTTDLEKADWNEFKGLSIDKDEQFTIYLKITDYAGHYTYISTDGYIVDMTQSNINIKPEQANENGYYNKDVDVDIIVEDTEPYSGIKSVEYWTTCDDKETQRETLYNFNIDNPKKEQLVNNLSERITVKSKENNSDNVKLYVKSIDNAGNETINDIALKINATKPKIEVSYDNNVAKIEGDRGYFSENRKATIKITERTSTFDQADATNGIKIKAVDVNGNTPLGEDGNPVVDSEGNRIFDDDGYLINPYAIVEWSSTFEGAKPDDAVHEATISYVTDANYTFEISYTDKAGNSCDFEEVTYAKGTVAPSLFTVDKILPTGTVIVEDFGTWDKLIDILTFGLWSKQTVRLRGTSDDITSPIKSVSYYKTDKTAAISKGDLISLPEKNWTKFDTVTVPADERFTVYTRIVDFAGNTTYLSTDGFIVDNKKSVINIKTDEPNANGIYNKNVNVLINVKEPQSGNSKVYSGLNKVEYWVERDGVETQREVLYSFDYQRSEEINSNGGTLTTSEWFGDGTQKQTLSGNKPTYSQLKNEFSKNVIVDADLNNSCNVVLYVRATDNAGNVENSQIKLDIDKTSPSIDVSYDNNNSYKVIGGHGYFSGNRTATVVITERTHHFDEKAASSGIKITAKNAKGEVVIKDCSKLISSWKTVEGSTPDSAKHIATINYRTDANYTFDVSYTDKAGNKNTSTNTGGSVSPYSFTVDKTAPTGTVQVGKLGVWDKLVGTLTFGLWSRDTVSITGTSSDVTSPIESVSYYKTSETNAMTVKDLRNLPTNAWTAFKGFKVSDNEQFTVYVRIVDCSGNTTYISTNGIIVDDTKPIVEEVKPEITITPQQPVNGLYNTDVRVAVKVEDPKIGKTKAYSGLKEIRYEIYNLGSLTQSGTLYSFNNESPSKADLCQIWEKSNAIIVDRNLNNSNNVVIKVFAVDNAGNKNMNSASIKIDVTKPSISVRYDNNDGDTAFANSTSDAFFKANRTATVTITERNFNSDKVKVKITNNGGTVPTLSSWSTSRGSGNGDNITHTATISYSYDGDYTFDISYVDEAGNANTSVNYGNSLAPQRFTVDKTVPTVSITYDNNEAMNGNYYKAQRIATISVTEHNFETSRVVVNLKATDNGKSTSLPTVNGWSSNGDVHTATIVYSADAFYTFDFDYKDKAGNGIVDISEQSFYIDKTAPVVSIDKIVDQSANNDEGNIGFVITATDTNFGIFKPVLTAVIKNGDKFETKQLDTGTMSDIANGKIYTVKNIETDGIYRITCTVMDKAGNAYSNVILQRKDGSTYVEKRSGNDTLLTFSVNREGSTFEIDKDTFQIVKKYYVQYVTDDISVVEINADPLKEYKVTLNDKELVENQDYTVKNSGGRGEWMKYIYTIKKSLCNDEGEYNLVVSSKDKADNDDFSDVKDARINFVVDRTAPVVAVTGLANDGRYQVEKQTVTLVPTDDGGALRSLVVRMVDKDGKEIKEILNLSDDAFVKALEDGAGKIVFDVDEGLYQNVQIICNDCAVDESGNTNKYDEIFSNVSVSSNAFMIFWANKPLRYGTISGVVLLIVSSIAFILIKKRKKSEY